MSSVEQSGLIDSASPAVKTAPGNDGTNGVDDLRDILPNVELVAEDGENLESEWHRLAMCLLIEVVNYRFRQRDDFYVGGNSFIYFSQEQARNRDFRGPDFFFVDGVARTPMRDYWVVWEEGGRYPNLIIELMSRSTKANDLGVKKDTYERVFHTYEYFCYDPETQHLQGWRLGQGQQYQPIEPDQHGRLYCEQLGLWLGTWRGTYQSWPALWLRFFDADGNIAPIRAEGEEHHAAIEKDLAETARRQADAAQQQADAEKQRADALQAEVARLRAQLGNKD